MPTLTKREKAAGAVYDREKAHGVEEAIGILEKLPRAKFDETVDLSLRLGVDPKHADQMVRGAVVLPHGIGKTVRVVVFAKGEKDKEAREAGADVVGAEDLVERVQAAGWTSIPPSPLPTSWGRWAGWARCWGRAASCPIPSWAR